MCGVKYRKRWISMFLLLTKIFAVTTDDNSEELDIRDSYDADNHNNPDMEHFENIREDTVTNSIPEKDLPKFGEPLQNVTIPVGREAILQCVVDNLQTYKIAWLRVDTQTILTIQNHVITKNHRMSITHAEKRAWILKIKDVKEADKGWYMCQINTDPMKSQVGYLDVVVPPDILDYPTSTDMVVREGSNVTLRCAATGSPPPAITWRREGSEQITLTSGQEVISYNGSILTIARVNRLGMGAYLCIASNGIPPTVSKRVMLIVHFPPMIWIQNQLVGAAIGQTITLECQSEAFPKSINYWMKNDTIIVPGVHTIFYYTYSHTDTGTHLYVKKPRGGWTHSVYLKSVRQTSGSPASDRFVPEAIEKGYKVVMRITVKNVEIGDFGSYKCVAKNSLGDTDGTIKLYHIPHTTPMTTIAPTVPLSTIPAVQKGNYKGSKPYQKPSPDLPVSKNEVMTGATSNQRNSGESNKDRIKDKSSDPHNYRSDAPNSPHQHEADHLTDQDKSASSPVTLSGSIYLMATSCIFYTKMIV